MCFVIYVLLILPWDKAFLHRLLWFLHTDISGMAEVIIRTVFLPTGVQKGGSGDEIPR